MKKIRLILSLLLLCFSASAIYSQSTLLNPNNPNILTDMIGDTCQGTGTLRYDDGVLANGGGWNTTVTDGRMVLKFTPTSYPWTFNRYCIALTRLSTGTANMTFDIVIYDTTGAGGTPGAVIYTLPGQTATGLLVFPQYSWFGFPLAGVPPLTGGSYYIGIKYSAVSQTGQFAMFDEAPTPLRTGYGWANAGPWTAAATYWATYTCWGMRTNGQGAVAPPPVLSRCRNGLNITLNDHSTISDSVQVALGNGCVVNDVNVRIDTMIHTWDADITFYLRKGSTGVNIVDNVGGSGDNFINTVLNDSATTPIASGVAPFTGSFRPSNPLTVFNTQPTDGYWKLVATDSATADTGVLRAWCVVIQYTCPVGGIQTVEIPNYYSLSQNYPNPFNPSTNIKFTMPKGDNVKLVIFDVLGREVRTLVNEFRNSGVYEVSFDASALSSGVYFYRLDAGEFTATKRMLLVK